MAQISYNEEKIFIGINNALQKNNPEILSVIFKLKIAFAQDLPLTYYTRYFYPFLKRAKDLVKFYSRNAKALEEIFQCLAVLFHILEKKILAANDINELYSHMSHYLSSKQPYYIHDLA